VSEIVERGPKCHYRHRQLSATFICSKMECPAQVLRPSSCFRRPKQNRTAEHSTEERSVRVFVFCTFAFYEYPCALDAASHSSSPAFGIPLFLFFFWTAGSVGGWGRRGAFISFARPEKFCLLLFLGEEAGNRQRWLTHFSPMSSSRTWTLTDGLRIGVCRVCRVWSAESVVWAF